MTGDLKVHSRPEVGATAWGRSQDVLRERYVNSHEGPDVSRNDSGKPTARFDVGDICEVIGAALVRQAEDLQSPKIAQLLDGCRVEVTQIGSGASGKRIAIQDTGSVQGWVSVVSSSGEALVRIIEKELRGAAREKRIEAAVKAARHDHGKHTARFEVGDVCHVITAVIVRKGEALDSPQVAKLPDRCQVEVLEIGSGPSGKRLSVRDEKGTQLLRKVKAPLPEPLPLPAVPVTLEEYPPVIESKIVETKKTRSQAPSLSTVPAASLAKFVEPFFLVSSTRAQRGFDLEISYLQREDIEQLLSEKFASEGIQEPSYDHLKLRDATGKWYRPGEAPDVPTPDLFPLTLYYRPPKPQHSAETVLTLRRREAYEALSPSQRKGLSEVQRQLECAYNAQNNDLVDRAMRLAHSLGLPLGTGGLPSSLMPESVCFPKGNEPLLYDGHIYSMHSTSLLVFDPPDFSVPMGIWNPQRQRVDPAVLQNEHPNRSDIVHFGKTFHMLEQGHIIDPDSQQVVGMIRPMTGDFEFFDPIPLQVAEFMMKRGFRLEAPTARLTNAPFVQILPEVEQQEGNPELHLHMQTTGSSKALKYAPLEDRGNKEIVMKAMREGHGHQSWKVMLYGSKELRRDRDVLAEAVKQDYTAMAYASPYYGDRNFMMKAVQQHGIALRYGTEEIRSDPDLAYAAVKTSWRAMKNVSRKLCGSSRIVREAVKQCWQALEYASEELRDDKDIVNLALKQSWRSLQFASLRLRGESGFMLKALSQGVESLQYAAPALCCDYDFMKQAVAVNGLALQYAAQELMDRELVLEAVRNTWRALEHAPPSLCADRAVVLEAVHQHHAALHLACPSVLYDEELVFEAAKKRPDFLRLVPESLRGSRGLMMKMVKMHPMSLQYASEELRCDEDLVLEALRRNFRSLQHAPLLRGSRSFMLRAVQVDALALSLADEELREDPQIVCEAVEREWEMLEHVCQDLRSNYAFMMEAVGIEGLSLKYASDELRCQREVVAAAIGNSGQALEFAALELQRDPEMVLMALHQDVQAILYADESLSSDFGFMFRAVRVDGLALMGASVDLRADPDLIMAAVKSNWRALKYACRSLRSNLTFMLQAVRINSFCLSMAMEDLWMNPTLLAAAAEEEPPSQREAPLNRSSPDAELWQVLQQARPGWSESDLLAAMQKLAVIGVTNVPLLSQALSSDLNGRLRAAGQKIFTATTVMELRARMAAFTRASAAADAAAAEAAQTKSRGRSSRPNGRLAF